MGCGDVAAAAGIDGHALARASAVEVNDPRAESRRSRVARATAPPQRLAAGRIEAAERVARLLHARSHDQHLGLLLHRDDDGRAVAEGHVRELALPLYRAVGLVEGNHVGITGVGHRAQQDHRILVENRTAAHRHVEVVRDNLFPPDELALEIQGRDDRGTEDAVDELAVGDGRGAGIAASGAGAEIVPPPGPWRHDRGPQPFSIRDAVAGDVVVGDQACLWLAIPRPLNRTNENPLAPHDRTGMPCTIERALPNDILIGGTSPAER